MSTEQNYNMIDGMMNNAPSMEELEARAKAGEERAVTAVAARSYFETKCPEASASLLIPRNRVII